jgi:hypothetical protein
MQKYKVKHAVLLYFLIILQQKIALDVRHNKLYQQ